MTKETSQMIKEKYNDFLDVYNAQINESLKYLKENIELLLKTYNFDKYVVYKDNSLDKDGNVRVFASIYKITDKGKELLPIKSEKEWKVIETILEPIQEESKKAENN